MNRHPSAEALWIDIQRAGSGALRHPDTLRLLVDAAYPAHQDTLFAMAFKAKFLIKTWGVLQRLGPDDPARAQLKTVFTDELEFVRGGIRELLSHGPEAPRVMTEHEFLSVTGESFVRMLDLLRDLAWVQNVKLDRESNA